MKKIKLITLIFLFLSKISVFSQPWQIGTSNTYWELLINGEDITLKITGSGDMPDFNSAVESPWYDIRSTLKFLEIGDSITKIGSYTFYGCSGLTGVLTLPSGLRFIGNAAFFNCSRLSGHLILPDNLTAIKMFAFGDCRGLTTLHLPDNLTCIEGNSFIRCSGLTSVSFPAGLDTIQSYAFNACSGLTSVSFPAGLDSIGKGAFSGCSGLIEIINPDPIPLPIDSTVFRGVDKSVCTLKVLQASLSAYQQAPVWKEFLIEGSFLSVIALSNDTLQGTVNGNYRQFYSIAGGIIKLEATPKAGYHFENWTSNGVIISTDNPFSFTVTQDTVITANFNNDVSIHERNNQEDRILIYPNPVKDRIYIQSFLQIEQISIYSANGKILKKIHNNKESFSVDDLASGIYFVKVKTENGEMVRKIIKE